MQGQASGDEQSEFKQLQFQLPRSPLRSVEHAARLLESELAD